MASQRMKKSQKNKSRLPRTAGLRTLSELTTELTAAGFDPSRIQERAQILAKIQGAARKRKRDEDMDVEMEDDGAWEDEQMDVDGEGSTPTKRAKANSGAVIAASGKLPRSNRQLVGLRDSMVRYLFCCGLFLVLKHSSAASIESDQIAKPRPTVTQYARQGGRERPCNPSQNGMFCRSQYSLIVSFLFLTAQASFCWKAERWQNRQEMISIYQYWHLYSFTRIEFETLPTQIHQYSTAIQSTSREVERRIGRRIKNRKSYLIHICGPAVMAYAMPVYLVSTEPDSEKEKKRKLVPINRYSARPSADESYASLCLSS
jgi:hypothetical protein